MKKLLIIALVVTAVGFAVTGCGGDHKKPGRAYMPDMSYSRAYETYADHSNLTEKGINYTAKPVEGTIARGDMAHFPLAQDKGTDTTNYIASKGIMNPLTQLTAAEKTEAERLYLVNCGICHGAKLDGNGPLWKGGDGPYPAAPKNLVSDEIKNMPAGQMFYSITYGKNLMGSYASQLNTKQRWMVVSYIQDKQGKTATAAAPATTAPVAADSTAKPAAAK